MADAVDPLDGFKNIERWKKKAIHNGYGMRAADREMVIRLGDGYERLSEHAA